MSSVKEERFYIVRKQIWIPGYVALLVTAVLLSGGDAASQEAAADGKVYKIGIVDRKEVFEKYNRKKDEYDGLQEEVKKRQTIVDELMDRIEKQKAEYDSKKDALSNEEREELESAIESDMRLYRSEFNRLQGDIDKAEERVVKKLFGDIDRAIALVGAEGNYHLVLDGTPRGAAATVVYFSPTLNMTGKVIDYLNTHDLRIEDEEEGGEK